MEARITTNEVEASPPINLSGVAVSSSAMKLMSPELQAILPTLVDMAAQQARINHLTVSKTEIDGFNDVEEGNHQIVITQFVEASSKTAMAYWDGLSEAVQEWIAELPIHLKRAAADKITLSVRWSRHGGVL